MPCRLLRCQGEPGITSASLSCLKFDVKPNLSLCPEMYRLDRTWFNSNLCAQNMEFSTRDTHSVPEDASMIFRAADESFLE